MSVPSAGEVGRRLASAGRRVWRNAPRTPARVRAAVAALRLLSRTEVDVGEHVAVAGRLLALGHSWLPVAVLDRVERRMGTLPEVTRLRRSAPRYVGAVPAHHLLTAASAVVGRPVRRREVVARRVGGGRSSSTVSIVRHVVRPEGASFLRKSVHRTPAREAQLYQSGLVAAPGRHWRAPTVLGVHHTPLHCHLFLEDLGPIRRPSAQGEFLDAALALAELAVQFQSQEVTEPWLRPIRPLSLAAFDADAGARRLLSPGVAARLTAAYADLRSVESELLARQRARTTTLCHGDAHAGNVAMDAGRPGAIVLFDWSSVHVGALGADLGDLLSVPFMSTGRRQLDPDACVDAYLEVIGRGSWPARDALQAYRHQMTFRSLRWWASRSGASEHEFAESDAVRLCEAVDALVADV